MKPNTEDKQRASDIRNVKDGKDREERGQGEKNGVRVNLDASVCR